MFRRLRDALLHHQVTEAVLRGWRVLQHYLWHRPPPGLRSCGSPVSFYRPRRIEGAQFISVGARTTILGHAAFAAISRYAGQNFTPRLEIGNRVYIGRYAYITCCNVVTIEDECVLSDHVYITDLAHGFDPTGGLILDQKLTSKGPVRIGRGTFLGYRACIMDGVVLGDHCVVGANAVVTKSFPSGSMVAGSPARCIKSYSASIREWVSTSEFAKATS